MRPGQFLRPGQNLGWGQNRGQNWGQANFGARPGFIVCLVVQSNTCVPWPFQKFYQLLDVPRFRHHGTVSRCFSFQTRGQQLDDKFSNRLPTVCTKGHLLSANDSIGNTGSDLIALHSCLISDVLGTYCFLPNVLSLILPHLRIEDFIKDLVYGNDVHLMFSSWFLGLIITLICT